MSIFLQKSTWVRANSLYIFLYIVNTLSTCPKNLRDLRITSRSFCSIFKFPFENSLLNYYVTKNTGTLPHYWKHGGLTCCGAT